MKNLSKRATFNEILTTVASHNAQSLMKKARTANRLAKVIQGSARQRAYSVKHKALISLTHRFPDRTLVKPDPFSPELVIVEVSKGQFGLHAPRIHFESVIE